LSDFVEDEHSTFLSFPVEQICMNALLEPLKEQKNVNKVALNPTNFHLALPTTVPFNYRQTVNNQWFHVLFPLGTLANFSGKRNSKRQVCGL